MQVTDAVPRGPPAHGLELLGRVRGAAAPRARVSVHGDGRKTAPKSIRGLILGADRRRDAAACRNTTRCGRRFWFSSASRSSACTVHKHRFGLTQPARTRAVIRRDDHGAELRGSPQADTVEAGRLGSGGASDGARCGRCLL